LAEYFDSIIEFRNLLQAYRKASRANNNKYKAYKFFFNLEKELLTLGYDLNNDCYSPGKLTKFKIYDPKEREISAAPMRDRVVYHAIFNLLEPVFERYMIADSYACRKGKGSHAAVKRAQSFLRCSKWYLKADIRKYFESIDHEVLMKVLSGRIKDDRTLNLFRNIIGVGESTKGLPIGNLTSQHFANLYLSKFDHYVKDFLGIKSYLRYKDDFVIFHNDKEYLKKMLVKIRVFLQNDLKLVLKEKAVFINKDQNGLSFLGWRIYTTTIRIRRQNFARSVKKIRKRLVEFSNGIIDDEKLQQSLASIEGHSGYFDSRQLLKIFFRGVNTVN